MTIEVREARDADASGLIALLKPIFEEYEGVLFVLEEMPELNQIATAFSAAGGQFWCALDNGRVIGSVGWTPAKSGNGIELKKLYVAKEQRGAGLASRLTALVEDAALKRGSEFIDLWSDTKFVTAHGFYQKRGYRKGPDTRLLHDLSDTEEFYFRKNCRAIETPSG